MKYRKKPVEVEAEQYKRWRSLTGEFASNIPPDMLRDTEDGGMLVRTPNDVMIARDGDWIVKERGHLRVFKPDIFEQTYERVED